MIQWQRHKKLRKTKSSQIVVDDIDVQVIRKKIKNLHLRVYPPDGCVRVTVPMHINDDEVSRTVLEKLAWIRKQQVRLEGLPEPAPCSMVSGEYHFYLGKPYILDVIERRGKNEVLFLNDSKLMLYVRPGMTSIKRQSMLNEWYRERIKELIPDLIARWEPIVGVTVNEWGVKKMKTRWGTCNISSRRIWLNLELIKRPMECLEYVLVHEMVHLLERYHNQNFRNHMNQFFPDWQKQDQILKSDPLVRDY